MLGILLHKKKSLRLHRCYSRIVRNRKFDREIAGTSLAQRCADPTLQALQDDVDRVLRSQIPTDTVLYSNLLRRCAAAKALPDGIRLHEHLARSSLRCEIFLWNLLIHLYGACGCPEKAREVFQEIPKPNAYSWNILVAAYAQNGHIHWAYAAFRYIPLKNIVSWSTMITAFVRNRQARRALILFRELVVEGLAPNKVTYLGALEACAATRSIELGREIHSEIGYCDDSKIATALIDMYGKCGALRDARAMLDCAREPCVVSANAMISAYVQHGRIDAAHALFDSLPAPNLSSWNAIIQGYAQLGHIEIAIHLYRSMDCSGFQPNTMTLLILLDACASIPAPVEGRIVHASIDQGRLDLDGPITTALVVMYARSGGIATAREIFDRMLEKDVVPWTAMIAAYAHGGHSAQALELFHRMALDGLAPNAITFHTILCACSHSGWLLDARGYFLAMQASFSIAPTADHFGALLDLLGRVGRIADAEELARATPLEPDPMAWTALIAACFTHGNTAAATRLFSRGDDESSSPYVLLHNNIARQC